MRLEDIGFYSLSDERARRSTERTRLERCELLLTRRCNFDCPYCRKVGPPDISLFDALRILNDWGSERLRNIRFSGGEPTLWPYLMGLVEEARAWACVEHIALSTNGSASLDWSAAGTVAWLDVDPPGGTLAASDFIAVDVCINANANSLAVDVFTDTLTFTNVTNGQAQTRGVVLTVLRVVLTEAVTSSQLRGGPI